VERNITEGYRKDELNDKLDTIYFKWIGKLTVLEMELMIKY